MKREIPIPWRRLLSRVLSLVLLLLLLVNLFLSPLDRGRSSGELYVYALDVGQSEATLVMTGNRILLIDSGTAAEQESLAYALARLNVRKIDVLLLTHLHEDHIGNARYLLQRFEVGEVLLPSYEADDLTGELLLQSIGADAVFLRAGYRFSLGFAEFEVLTVGDTNGNDASAVLRGRFGNQVLLFMGDAGKAVEYDLISRYGAAYLDCDYLKIGHHGSNTGTTAEFLAATTPAVASISCGRQNSYGFPHERVLDDLARFDVEVARTDKSGTVIFATDGRTWTRLSSERGRLGK